MSRQCEICGKTAVMGNQVTMRGKAKYLGGNGRKTTGISRRQFRPNLQRIQVQEGGSVVRRRVCTQCIRSGRIVKAVVRKPFTLPVLNAQ
jgi:large subunit ribosomal protein L28